MANNLLVDLGRGLEAWALWRPGPPANSPVGIKIAGLSGGELLREHLLITGNLLYDSGPDGLLEDGHVVIAKPQFKYAVWIEPETAARMKHLRFTGNLFAPGEHGVSNVPLPP